MAVYKRGYQRYQGQLTGRYTRLLALPRFAWARLFEMRVMVVLMVVGLFWPLLCSLFIYISNHTELWAGFGGDLKRFLSIDGNFFLTFMNVQASFAMILAAIAGPGLIAPDISNNALPLYFSRPLSRLDYVAARFMVLAGILSCLTLLPAAWLFTLQTGLAGFGWLFSHWYYVAGVVLGFSLWIVVVTLVALACSAYVKWRVVAGALVLAFFFILAGIGVMIDGVFNVEWGQTVSPARALYTIWCELLRTPSPRGLDAWECASVLGGIVVVLAFVLERKLHPVEVIS